MDVINLVIIIMKREKYRRQFRLLFPLSFIGQFIVPVGGEGMRGIGILSRYKFHLIRELENLV